jgi:hypothetical protein
LAHDPLDDRFAARPIAAVNDDAAPSAANRSATYRPTPSVEPVMSAVLPFMVMGCPLAPLNES